MESRGRNPPCRCKLPSIFYRDYPWMPKRVETLEKKRVNLADDPCNRVMVRRHLHLLPQEILLEILSRLPITSLIRFKTTSRAGYDLIVDARLPPMLSNRVSDSDPCLILFNYNFSVSPSLQFYFVESEDCSGRVRKIDPPKHSGVDNLVGSCNGLLCLSFPIIGGSSESDSLLIYNPFVGDAVRVPSPANRFLYQNEVFGFGFHPRTGEFKVVRIVTGVDPAFQVFTVGTTEWITKGAPPPQFRLTTARPPETLVEGSLYWVIDVGTTIFGVMIPSYDILSFNLADEVFEEIPHPPCQRFVSNRYSLSVLNGCLSAAGLVETGHFDIWVMKQYHVKESWVKQFSFSSSSVSRLSKIICALKNGEILLQNEDSSLVSYDPVENRFKILQISGLPNRCRALPFLPSLFSAKATMNLQF